MSENSLKASATLIDAISVIEATEKRLAVVVSDNNLVLGTLTDGRYTQVYNSRGKA